LTFAISAPPPSAQGGRNDRRASDLSKFDVHGRLDGRFPVDRKPLAQSADRVLGLGMLLVCAFTDSLVAKRSDGMTDRELLEAAAKAAGYDVRWHEIFGCFVHVGPFNITNPPTMAGQ
jgi:hypothetical protein